MGLPRTALVASLADQVCCRIKRRISHFRTAERARHHKYIFREQRLVDPQARQNQKKKKKKKGEITSSRTCCTHFLARLKDSCSHTAQSLRNMGHTGTNLSAMHQIVYCINHNSGMRFAVIE